MSILEVKSLSSGYKRTIIIRNINFSVDKGRIVCILGRNGVGKSTLLKTIMGVVPAVEGEIFYKDISLKGLKPFQITRKGIAYVPQEAAIFPNLTLTENLAIGFSAKNFNEAKDKTLIYFPQLKDHLKQKAGTLSGGETKMLVVCRAIMGHPKLLILDEVTEGLQPSIVNTILETLHSINKEQGTTIIFVEQNLSFARQIAQDYIIMNQGIIVESGLINDQCLENIESHLVL